MSNTITAFFKGRVGVAEAVYQNDYGIVMAFDSIDLPAHFDCYFSRLNQEEALPGVGADNRVAIPNSILADPGNVTVHVPLHIGENDSEVEYVVYFKVIGRARPIDDGTPTQMTAIEQALALLQNPITNIEQIVNEALAFTGETIEELQSDFDTLQAQFDTAIGAVTTDTEVTDIRVGADGVTDATAGASVRRQFTSLKRMSIPSETFNWVQNRNIQSNGSYSEAGNDGRAACSEFIPVKKGYVVKPRSGYIVRFAHYTTDVYTSVTNVYGFANSSIPVAVPNDGYIRIALKKTDNSDITKADAEQSLDIICNDASNILTYGNIMDGVSIHKQSWYDNEGVLHAAARMAFTDKIPVEQGLCYIFEGTYDDTDDGVESTNRIVGFDKDGDFVKTLLEVGIGGDGEVTPIKWHFFNTDSRIKYVSISYNFKCIADPALNVYGTSYYYKPTLKWLADKTDATFKEKYAIKRNNSSMVQQMIDVALSYANQKDQNDEYILHYGNRTPLEYSYENDGSIDCSTFIGFVLRGIPFNESPYAVNSGEPDYDDDGGDSTDHSSSDDTGDYNFRQWTANPNYSWSIDPCEYELTLDYNYTVPAIIENNERYATVRRASQIAQLLAQQGREVPMDEHLNNIEVGDIVFWSRKKNEHEWLQPYRYRFISHIALVIKKEKAPSDATWDTEKHPWKHTAIEVTNAGEGNDVIHTRILEIEGADTATNVNTLSFVVRPDLGGITAIAEKSENDVSVIGEMKYDADYLYLCIADNVWKRIPLEDLQ